jgi:hypothetical protein
MRLRDGAKAIEALAKPEPVTLEEHEAQLEVVMQGARALQSLDDLGSRNSNNRAWKDLVRLSDRIEILEGRIKSMKEISRQ